MRARGPRTLSLSADRPVVDVLRPHVRREARRHARVGGLRLARNRALRAIDPAVQDVGIGEVALRMQHPSGLLQTAESRVDLYRRAAARMEPS